MFNRIRSAPLSIIILQLCSWFTYLIWIIMLGGIEDIRSLGIREWLLFELSGTFSVPLIFVITFQLNIKNPAEAVKRPLWILKLLFIASLTAQAISIGISYLEGRPLMNAHDRLWVFHLLTGLLLIMILGGAVFWLSILFLLHSEDQAALARQLIKKSQLERKIAHSRLMAARAQIDPKMIARILQKVKSSRQDDGDKFHDLLNHLISYLRLAMNRLREQRPSLTTDLSLIKSYLALREAETGVLVELRVEYGQQAPDSYKFSPPLFDILKKCFDNIIVFSPSSLDIHIVMQPRAISVIVKSGDVRISEDASVNLATLLKDFLSENAPMLNFSFKAAENWYSLSIAE